MAKIDDIIADLKAELQRAQYRFDFDELQHAVGVWSARNFGEEAPLNSVKNVLGIIEEVGELTGVAPENAVLMIALGRLSHHHLKELQEIRGTSEEHQAKIKDALGDVLIYIADYCFYRQFAMQDIVEQTWARVSKRDWTKNKQHGGDVASAEELALRRPYHTQAEEIAAINKAQRERAIQFGIDPSDAEPPRDSHGVAMTEDEHGAEAIALRAGIDTTQPPTPEEEAAMLEDERRARVAEAAGEDIPF